VATSIDKRRKLRSLEALRDKHLESIKASRAKLAQLRADIKHHKGVK
jgi:hypothetical protein